LQYARAIASHVVSAPLTSARHLDRHVKEFEPHHTLPADHARDPLELRWCCIGARAEATLPVEYWREVLLVLGKPVHIHLNFVGPDVHDARQDVTLSYRNSILMLRWMRNATFHEYYEENDDELLDYDAYILLNPGVGHPHLQKDWRPTLDLLFDHSRNGSRTTPVVLTAHSEIDAARDGQYLRDLYFPREEITYHENPFASRIHYEDPFDDGHMVRPNHYATVILTST
jgi:splicing suppressor protein 51